MLAAAHALERPPSTVHPGPARAVADGAAHLSEHARAHRDSLLAQSVPPNAAGEWGQAMDDIGARVVGQAVATPDGHLGSRVRNGLGWGLANSFTMRLGSLLLGIVLARLLTPEAFGVFAVALTVQTILMNFADPGMSADLVRRRDWKRRAPTVASISLLTGGLLAAAMIAAAPLLASTLGSDQAAPVIAVLSLSLVIAAAGVTPLATIQREFQQSRFFFIVATSFLIGSGLTVALIVFFDWGAMALAVGKLVEQACTVGLQFALTRTRPRFGFDRAVAHSALSFGLPVAGANALSWLVLSVDYIVIGRAAGAVTLGFYVLAFTVSSGPANAVVQAVRNVALPGFSRLDRSTSAENFVSSFGLVLAAGLLVGVLLATLAIPTVTFVYGSSWLRSADALKALALFGAMRIVIDLAATFLIARGASKPVLYVQVAWLFALVPAMVLGVNAGGLVGAGIAHLAVGLIVVFPAYALALKQQGVSPRALGRVAAPPVGAAAVTAAAIWASIQAAESTWQALLIGGFTGILVYFALLHRWLRSRLLGSRQHRAVPRHRESTDGQFVRASE
jgi:lipopolysaccharide exporter